MCMKYYIYNLKCLKKNCVYIYFLDFLVIKGTIYENPCFKLPILKK